jgi:hypothetical protein
MLWLRFGWNKKKCNGERENKQKAKINGEELKNIFVDKKKKIYK